MQTLKQLTRKGTAEALAFDATVEEYHEICLRVRYVLADACHIAII